MKKQTMIQSDFDLLSQYGLHGIDLKNAGRFLFEQGEYLLREGEPIDCIYFIVSGKAKVCLNVSNGRQLLLCYFMSNGIFGDVELMTGMCTAFTTMQAVSDFICVGLPLKVYAPVLKNNVAFINHIGKELAEKLMQSNINRAITVLHPLEARLCAYITQIASGGIFRETLTEVAELLGTSYRHLLRSLDKLCQDKILQKQVYGYRIIDQQALNKRAGDLYVLKYL